MRLLSEEDLGLIHRSALEVLWEVGARVSHPRAQSLLKGFGCRVEGEAIKFPVEIVREMRQMTAPAPYAAMLPLRIDAELAQRAGGAVIPVATGQGSGDGPNPACVESWAKPPHHSI